MPAITEYKCPSCGAPLAFDAESGEVTCASCGNTVSIEALRALRESGRSIPEDCSIIAIDGINVSEYIHPMLTTLCQPMTAMGTKSVELLLGVIRGGAHDHLTLPTTLRAGESVRDLTK